MTAQLRSELLKLSTTRMWWGLLVGIVAGSVGFAVLTASLAGRSIGGAPATPGVTDPAIVRSIYTAGLQVAYLCTLSLGVVTMAGERHHRTLTATMLASPRRWPVVAAKLAAMMIAGVGYGAAAVLAGVAAGLPVVVARGGQAHLVDAGVPRALALGVLAIALWGVLGLGIGTLIPNQLVAIVVAIVVALLVEPLLALGLNALHAGQVARFLPTQATGALVEPSTQGQGLSIDLLPWWAAALVLLGYALGIAGLGARLTLRRDVT